MFFKDHLEQLPPLDENRSVLITLTNGETFQIDPIEGKSGSLRVVQSHLGEDETTSGPIDLAANFCEYFLEWKEDPNKHATIGFLDRYNTEGGSIHFVS